MSSESKTSMEETTPKQAERQPEQLQRPISMLSVRLGPLSLRAWLFTALVAFVGFLYYKQLPPDISNAEYIRTLLQKDTLARTAGSIIRDARPESTGDEAAKAAEEAKWTAIADKMAKCFETEAQNWLDSGDPYLSKHFERDTPNVVGKRLFTACNAMQYEPKPKDSK